MAFDGIVTHAVTEELNTLLSTGRVTKIHQPHKTELVLVIRAMRNNYKVLLSMNAQYARIQLTEKSGRITKKELEVLNLWRKNPESDEWYLNKNL